MDQMDVLLQIRANIVAPVLKVAVSLCLISSVMLMLEKVLMGAISLYAKIFRRRPEKIYKCDPIRDDEEIGNLAYPMVLVQIPMYNEKQVRFLLPSPMSKLFLNSSIALVKLLIFFSHRYTNSLLELHAGFCGRTIEL